MKLTRSIIFFIILMISGLVYGDSGQSFETGKIINRVLTLSDPAQSYALYLPSAYTPDQNWPLLFCFDPGARSEIPLNLFKNVAEKHGYMVVCSNNLKNGPWPPVFKALKATWVDVLNRFSIDFNRIYTAGFSGGARAAAAFPHITGAKVTAIIACGAGLPPAVKAAQIKPAFYHGIVGVEDYNYKEFVRLGRELKEAGVDSVIEVINNGHSWPPENICSQAIEAAEIRAMKKGLREKDIDLVEMVFNQTLERARQLETTLNIYFAAKYCMSRQRLFRNLIDTGPIDEKIMQLKATRDFNKFQREEEKRNRTELEYIQRFLGVFTRIKNYEQKRVDLRKISSQLDLHNLVREAAKKQNKFQSAMAKRLIDELVSKGNSEGHYYLKKHDFTRAVIFFETAAKAKKTGIRAFYNLACTYSLQNRKKEAIENLKIAIKNLLEGGHKDFSFLEKDKDLAFIRDEKEFQNLLKQLGSKPKR
ncbi:MAG: hypothetical protein KAT17_00980 [Candidatus Aminicenantes bacterium]|nr:hypothetical protein [Candidatus Aminicenantes bacterium]